MFFSQSLYHSGNKVLCWAPKWLVVDAVAAPLLLPYNLNSFHFFTSYCYVGCGRLTDMEVPSAKLTPTHTCRSRVWTPQCFTVGHCLKIVIELFVLRCTYAEILLFRVRFFTLFFFSNNDYLHFCSVKYSTVRIVNHVCLEKTASYLQGRSMFYVVLLTNSEMPFWRLQLSVIFGANHSVRKSWFPGLVQMHTVLRNALG